MGKIPDNTVVWGFAFVKKFNNLNIRYFDDILYSRRADLKRIIYSTWDSEVDQCTWIVAAERYLDEDEVKETVDFIVENEFEDEFYLTKD